MPLLFAHIAHGASTSCLKEASERFAQQVMLEVSKDPASVRRQGSDEPESQTQHSRRRCCFCEPATCVRGATTAVAVLSKAVGRELHLPEAGHDSNQNSEIDLSASRKSLVCVQIESAPRSQSTS